MAGDRQAQTSDDKNDLWDSGSYDSYTLYEKEVLDIQVGKGSNCFLFETCKSAKDFKLLHLLHLLHLLRLLHLLHKNIARIDCECCPVSQLIVR